MRKTLNWIKSHYGDVPVYVTSNAFSDTTGELNDTDRVEYHREYINEMLKGNVLLSVVPVTPAETFNSYWVHESL